MPTLSDVARLAGVSTATVSHVINSTRRVRPETAARVQRVIVQLNYVPNPIGRLLARQKIGPDLSLSPLTSADSGGVLEPRESATGAVVARLKGYVAGRELREGCLIPTIGGGLCQLSNALYDTALRAGFEIVERHGHTQIIPGSLAEVGRDATVFWNYVDLRFKSNHAFRIEAELTVDSLVVRFRGEPVSNRKLFVFPAKTSRAKAEPIESCLSCNAQDCFRQVGAEPSNNDFGRKAYLVDEYWPEFDRYISATKRDTDLLCIPLDGKRFRRSNYAWTTKGFGTVKRNSVFTLWRSYRSRKLATQGALRQRALLAAHEKLARRYASQLSYDITHLTLTSSLLPFLWRSGELGGRTFDVFMTGLPLAMLQERLDAAFLLHPESRTLSDFRAESWLVDAESEALGQARQIITPHTEIAALYPEKSVLIDWTIPTRETRMSRVGRQPRIVFPAATVGRKGAYELRDAVIGLDIQLAITGPILEGDSFWDGLGVVRLPAGEDWLGGATAVVLPAFVEQRPRRLLEAVARGIPVIASSACGLENIRGVTTVPAGDVGSLRAEIEKACARDCRTFDSSQSRLAVAWVHEPSRRSNSGIAIRGYAV